MSGTHLENGPSATTRAPYCPHCGQTLPATPHGIALDVDEGTVARGGKVIRLTETPFLVFEAIHSTYPRIAWREHIYDWVYGRRGESKQPDPKSVDVFITKMRPALRQLGLSIVNNRGKGYRLICGELPA